MARKLILAFGAASMLTACSSYPRLVAIRPPNSQSTDVASALTEASKLQTEYSDGYTQSAQIRDFSQLPIIGVAAAAAWVLLDGRAGAARRVGRMGILAGAYSEMRGQLVAPDMPEIYIAGHTALSCVLAQGSYFSGTQAETRLARMNTSLQKLNRAIVTTTALVAAQPGSGTDPELALLRTTKAAAELAITQARAIASTAWSEAMAYDGAGPIFWQALSSISARVASRGRQRPQVDYEKLVAEFAPAGPTAQGGGRAALTLVEELTNQMGLLTEAASELRGTTQNYNERLGRVAACPTQAG